MTMNENENGMGNGNYFDRTTYSQEELRQQAPPYDKKADKAARKAAKLAAKNERLAAKAQARALKRGGVMRKVALCVSLGLCFGAFAGLGFYGIGVGRDYFFPAKDDSAVTVDATALPQNSVETAPSLPSLETEKEGQSERYVTYVTDDVSDMVEKVMPAMVSIVNSYVTTGRNFWGETYSEPRESSGSGIIVGSTDTELLLATNNHVVEGAQTLKITFIDGSEAEALIKGTDADMDIAVLAVPVSTLSEETKKSITIAQLGDSDNLKMGMPVVAIGNALGYGQSVTNGIISALDREMVSEDGSTGKYIQTNAAINHGNSGGALLNRKGEVIGINVARIDDGSVSVEAMGYAIPISAATPIIEELMEREIRTEKAAEGERGYLGIYMQTVTDDIAAAYGFPKGIYIREVEPGSPAEAAGIKVGDFLIKFDGQRVTSGTGLQDMLQYYTAGEKVVVTVKRAVDGEYQDHELEVTLGRRPEAVGK